MAKPKNIGDQIRDAIENAVQARDYSGLRSSIEDSLDMAAGLVAQGLHQAAQAAQSMQEKSAQQKALQAQALQQEQERLRREQELALAKECYGSTTGKKFTGYAMIALGGAGVLASLVLLAVFAPLAFAGPVVAAFAAPTVASAGFALASGVLCGLGARRISLVKRFQAYRGVLATRFMCPLEELAAQTGRTVKFVRKDVRKMIDAGLFKQGHLDDAQTQISW